MNTLDFHSGPILFRGELQRDRAIEVLQSLPLDQDRPLRMVIDCPMPKRSIEQNAMFHSLLNDIAEQIVWHGQKFTLNVWKRLCTAAWLREHNEQPTLIPALDGKGFDVIFEHTSKLNTRQFSELIEWCMCFGAQQNVVFKNDLAIKNQA